MSADVARILREAAEILEREGWCPRLGGGVHEGPFCAVEAITEAADRSALWDAHGPALDVLRAQIPTAEVGPWNDRQSSPEPVVAALRAAADEAEAS